MKNDDCRRYAKECERLSKIATDPKTRTDLLALSQAWLDLEKLEPAEEVAIASKPSLSPDNP
jgi:hypothetical protein